jgi:hypothetical protein
VDSPRKIRPSHLNTWSTRAAIGTRTLFLVRILLADCSWFFLKKLVYKSRSAFKDTSLCHVSKKQKLKNLFFSNSNPIVHQWLLPLLAAPPIPLSPYARSLALLPRRPRSPPLNPSLSSSPSWPPHPPGHGGAQKLKSKSTVLVLWRPHHWLFYPSPAPASSLFFSFDNVFVTSVSSTHIPNIILGEISFTDYKETSHVEIYFPMS